MMTARATDPANPEKCPWRHDDERVDEDPDDDRWQGRQDVDDESGRDRRDARRPPR